MPRLDETERHNAIYRLQVDESCPVVVVVFHVSPRNITILRRRYQHEGTTRDLSTSGKPHVTIRAKDRYIQLHHLQDSATAAFSAAPNIPPFLKILAQTSWNHIRKAGLRVRQAVISVILRVHRRKRRCIGDRHTWYDINCDRDVFS